MKTAFRPISLVIGVVAVLSAAALGMAGGAVFPLIWPFAALGVLGLCGATIVWVQVITMRTLEKTLKDSLTETLPYVLDVRFTLFASEVDSRIGRHAQALSAETDDHYRNLHHTMLRLEETMLRLETGLAAVVKLFGRALGDEGVLVDPWLSPGDGRHHAGRAGQQSETPTSE